MKIEQHIHKKKKLYLSYPDGKVRKKKRATGENLRVRREKAAREEKKGKKSPGFLTTVETTATGSGTSCGTEKKRNKDIARQRFYLNPIGFAFPEIDFLIWLAKGHSSFE